MRFQQFLITEKSVGRIFLDQKAIDRALQNIANDIEIKEFRQYFLTNIRNWIIRDYTDVQIIRNEKEIYDFFNKGDSLNISYLNTTDALEHFRRKTSLYIFALDGNFYTTYITDIDQIEHIFSWMIIIKDEFDEFDIKLQTYTLELMKKMHKMHVEDLYQKVTEWFRERAKYKEKEVLKGKDDYKIILKVSGGYKWVELNSKAAYEYEGEFMDHCVASYGNRIEKEEVIIWSLRDSKNIPHVTMELYGIWNNYKIKQCKGRSNSIPVKYEKQIMELFKNSKYNFEFLTKDLEKLNIIRGSKIKGKDYN